jgi:hypothetical protein
MNEELDKKLCEKYPKIFRDRYGDMMTTAMCWGFPGDGWYNIIDRLCANIQWHIDQRIESNERCQKYLDMVAAARAGNFTPFNEYYAYLSDHPVEIEKYRKQVLEDDIPEYRQLSPEIPQVVATQVKEKFGTLRFYYDGGNDIIDGMVRMAEAMSEVTCEQCGAPGEERGGGWIVTLCDTHAGERKGKFGAVTAVELFDDPS